MTDDASRSFLKIRVHSRANATLRRALTLAAAAALAVACSDRQTAKPAPEPSAAPRHGGRLVTALRGEPRTLNPVTAVDRPSQLVIHRLMADLLHINRSTQEVESALADSWTVSEDGLVYRLTLRPDVLFSDGEPFDADDVMFSFRVYLDEEMGYPGRDLLRVGGRPIEPRKIDAHTVEFHFAEPAAAGLRLFDGLAILPQHRLATAYEQGDLSKVWGPATAAAQIAGLGPFRLREYLSGERIVLERNPNYWKVDAQGGRLPYLDELVLLFVPSEDAQVIRFKAGETDIIEGINPSNFSELERGGEQAPYEVRDLGAGLSYVFLVFNQNDGDGERPAGLETRQSWFRRRAFRQAVSAAVDREAIVRLAYRNRATPLWSHVSPGYRYWFNDQLPQPERSLAKARQLLSATGFGWSPDDQLLDPAGEPVEFSIIASSSNSQRLQVATLVQEDLRQLGMKVSLVSLEFRAFIQRLLTSQDYDACLMELSGPDSDPNPQINTLLSSGDLHLWRLGEPEPATAWEAEIDQLMRRQISTMDRAERKRLFDRVQLLMAEEVPLVFLASPHVLAGAKRSLGNFRPAVLPPNTLWNVDQLYWREPGR
jgi:peptide/nickel transport system substrate-binding protein